MKLLIFCLSAAVLAFPQTKGTTEQQAKDCAQNFIGNNNTGTVTCYNVDKKLADQISQLVIASKHDGKALKDISDKIDLLLKEQSQTANIIQQAPNGINIGPGAIVPNPQVFNAGPPPPHLRFTEEVTVPLPADGNGEKVVRVHIFTDRSIPGAVVGLIVSGPSDLQGRPELNGTTATQFDFGLVAREGKPVPNSLAVIINIPAAFMPLQELIVPIKSKTDVHVLEVFQVGN